MKAKNSNPGLNYNLNEGKHKKTLLEKYLNEWNGDERFNGDLNLGASNFNTETKSVENSLKESYSKKLENEYKEFLANFDNSTNYDTEANLVELDRLIKSKREFNKR